VRIILLLLTPKNTYPDASWKDAWVDASASLDTVAKTSPVDSYINTRVGIHRVVNTNGSLDLDLCRTCLNICRKYVFISIHFCREAYFSL
jgi:hypothetical protein